MKIEGQQLEQEEALRRLGDKIPAVKKKSISTHKQVGLN